MILQVEDEIIFQRTNGRNCFNILFELFFFTVFISIGSITKGKVALVGHKTVTVVWTENGVICSKPVDKGTILHHFPRRCSWPSAKKSALFALFFVFFVCFASATYSKYLQEIEVIFFLFDFSFN
jgi:hypothetical protein